MDVDDEYITQLKNIFSEFCRESGKLDPENLSLLCERLSLDARTTNQILSLAFDVGKNTEAFIGFERFCDCFVVALSNVESYNNTTKHEVINECDHTVAQTKPRLVKDGRQYGRKSLPSKTPTGDCVIDGVTLYSDNINGKSIESSHWSCDTVATPSDDERESTKEYYECDDERTKYFEANGDGTGDASFALRLRDKKRLQSTSQIEVDDDSYDVTTTIDRTNFFSEFDEDGSGQVQVRHLIEMWKSSGISDPILILHSLEVFPDANGIVNAYRLSSALEKHVMTSQCSCVEAERDTMVCALVTSFRHQLLHVNTLLDHYRVESEEMKDTLNKSEIRNHKMIEEADDRYLTIDQQNERRVTQVERKWQRKFEHARCEFERERDAMTSQANFERETLRAEIDELRKADEKSRDSNELLRMENESLSRESSHLYNKLTETEKDAQRLRNDLECLLAAQINEQGDPINTSQEEKFAMIIKEYEAQCRHLADRNDELATEADQLRAVIKQQRNNSIDNRLTDTADFSKKKNRNRNGLVGDDSSDSEAEDRHHMVASQVNNMRMAELESCVERLKRESKESGDLFEKEKSAMRDDFEAKLNAVEREVGCRGDNKAFEEQQLMTMQLLKEMTQQRDQLETDNNKLKEEIKGLRVNGQKELADLCREFANEKSEIVTKHDEKTRELEEECNTLRRVLNDEKKGKEMFGEQLKVERDQHQEALCSLEEVIDQLKTSKSVKENTDSNEIAELNRKFDTELSYLKRQHSIELQAVKREAEDTIEQAKAEQLQVATETAVCSELERLQESIEAERNSAHSRLQEMRESFEREAELLRHELECDKEVMRKQFQDEISSMKNELNATHGSEMARKREEAEEKERQTREEESAEIASLQREIDRLEVKNLEMETWLGASRSDQEELEERLVREAGKSADVAHLEDRVSSLNSQIIIKDEQIIDLKQQSDVIVDQLNEKSRLVTSLQNKLDAYDVIKSSLQHERDKNAEKVHSLEREKVTSRMESASIAARCSHMERCGADRCDDQTKMERLEKEINKLRKKARAPPRGDRSTQTRPLECTEEQEESADLFRCRYHRTRKQLTDQMKKMKDLYSKLTKTEVLVKDLYCENGHMMRALQLTESRQKTAEKKYREEKEKNESLANLLHSVCPKVT